MSEDGRQIRYRSRYTGWTDGRSGKAAGVTSVIRAPVRRHKYNARAVEIDGHRFPSQAEGMRYVHLRLLQRTGAITGLTLQPEYPITVAGIDCGKYIADFRYVANGQGTVIEDVKGVKTDVYKLKRRLVEAIYGIKITEVGKGRPRARRPTKAHGTRA